MAFRSLVGKTITIDQDDYTYEKCLKLGLTASVYTLTPLQRNRPELIAKQFFSKKSFQKELQILSSCYHDNIISHKQYHGMVKDQCIIYEKIDFGDLVDFVTFSRAKYLSPKLIISLFYQILQGISHIHQRGYAHIDIKPDNILIKKNGRVKVIDFDHSANCNNSDFVHGGTECYQSPELVINKCINYKATDIYSLGVVFLTLMVGCNYFQSFSTFNTYQKYKQNEDYFWSLQKNKGLNGYFINDEFVNLIKSMWSEDPNERPTIEEVMQNKIITDNLLSNEEYAQEIAVAMTPLAKE